MLVRPSCPGSAQPRKKRLAATALEYLFAVSLILVVCIVGIQSVGNMLKKSASSSAQKIEKSNPVK